VEEFNTDCGAQCWRSQRPESWKAIVSVSICLGLKGHALSLLLHGSSDSAIRFYHGMVREEKPTDRRLLPYVKGIQRQYQTGDSPARNRANSNVNFSNGERKIGGEDMGLIREAIKMANRRHSDEKEESNEDRNNIVTIPRS